MNNIIQRIQDFLQKFKYVPAKNMLLYTAGVLFTCDLINKGENGHINYVVKTIKPVLVDVIRAGSKSDDLFLVVIAILLVVIFRKNQ